MLRLSAAALLAAGLAALATTADAAPAANTAKPNVIVILSDDVGWAEFGFQGCKDIPTPNIDSIASSGVKFTSGYVAATVCSPSRAGLMTGRYPTRFGHEFNGGGGEGGAGKAAKGSKGEDAFGLPLTETLFPQRMKALGYATCCIGKWHLGGTKEYLPMARGFDEFYGTVANTTYYNPPQFIDSRKSKEVDPVQDPNFYTTEAYRDRAIDYIGKQQGKPYFLYLPFNADHGPLQPAAPQKYMDRFPDIKDQKRKEFAGAMAALDDAVGGVLKKVRDLGQEESTLIIFFSDNGGPTWQTTASNLPLRGSKGTTSEGGTRIPYCMQWKGKIPAGSVYDHPIQNLDLLPTAVTAAGGKIDPAWKLDGVDLLLLPETLAAVRAARANRLQTSMNLAIGSALACSGLTVPVVVLASLAFDLPLVLGLAPKDISMLSVTFLVSAITLGTGRTYVMQGAVHLVLFAAFLFLAFVP
jgi:arylsulfatase A-like enzyme